MEYFFEQIATNKSEQPFAPALALARAQCWLQNLSFASAHRIMTQWQGFSLDEAEAALTELWGMTHIGVPAQPNGRPFGHPFFWAPYILIGE